MKNKFSLPGAIAAFLMATGSSAIAANVSHTLTTSTGTANWSTATWSNGTPITNPGDIAVYNTAVASTPVPLTLTLDVNVTIGEIESTNSNAFTISQNAGNTTSFTLDPTGLATATPFKTFDAAIANTSSGVFTVAPNITIANGNLDLGTTGTGALNISGAITGTGNILTQTTSSGALNLSGLLNNSGTLTVGGPTGNPYLSPIAAGNSTSNSAAITTISGGIGSSVTGLSVDSGVLNLTSADASTGVTTVNGGTLNLNAGGSLAGNVSVLGGIFNDAASTIASTSTLTVGGLDSGSTFNETSTTTAQNLAVLSVTPGISLITNSNAGELNFAGGAGGYLRSNGGIVTLGSTTSNDKITFTAAPTGSSVITGTNGTTATPILNGAVTFDAGGAEFVADQAGAVSVASYLANDTFAADGNAVVTVSDNESAAALNIESLKFDGASGDTLTLAAGVNTINSGGIILESATGNTISGGTLTAAPGQDIWVYGSASGHNLTINSVIADNAGGQTGLTFDGTGSAMTLAGANTFTGAIYIDGSNTSFTNNLNLNNVNALGATTATAALELLGSTTINNNTNNTITIDRTVVLGAGSDGIGNGTGFTGGFVFNGNFVPADTGTDNSIAFNKNGTDTITLNGSLAGVDNFNLTDAGGVLNVNGQYISDNSAGWTLNGNVAGATVNVAGFGALSEDGDFNFGANATGNSITLNVSGDAFVGIGGRFFIGKDQVGTSTVNQSGGLVSVNNLIIGGGNGSTGDMYNLTGGTLAINAHNTVNTIDSGAILNVSGGTLVFGASDGNQTLGYSNSADTTAGQIVVGTGGLTVNSIGTSGNILSTYVTSGSAHDGGFTKTNSGTLTFMGGNYNGATTVAGGTLKEDFTAYATSQLAAGGTASNDINSASALVLSGGTMAINGAKAGAGATSTVTGSAGNGIGTQTTGTANSGATTVTVASATNLVVGEVVTGTGIQAGTTIASISGTTVTLNLPTTSALAAGAIDFYPTATGASGGNTITVIGVGSLAVGQTITGTGIAAGSTITNISGSTVTLSQATTGAVSGEINNINSNTVVVTNNSAITVGELVTGAGIASGTYVEAIYSGFGQTTSTILLSQPTTGEPVGGSTLTFAANNSTNIATVQSFNGTTVNAGGNALTLTNNGSSITANLGAITRNVGGTLNMPATTSTTIVTTTTAADATGILGPWATVGSGTSLAYATVNGTGQVVAYGNATADTTGSLANVTSATTNYKFTGASTTLGANQTGNTLQFTGTAGTLSLNNSTLTLNGLMNSSSGALSVGATSVFGDSIGADLVVGSTNELVIQSDGQNVTINDSIVDASPGSGSSLTWNGGSATAVLALNPNDSAVEGYTGTTYDDQGIISLGTQTALENSTVYLGGGTLTDTVSSSPILGGLAGNGNFAAPTAITNLEVGNNNQSTTYSGVLSGAVGLQKIGTGSLTLSGANTYTGPTLVNTGTLAVNGSTAAGSSVLVSATSGTATLTGTGTIGGPVTLQNAGGTAIFNPGGVGAVGQTILSSNLTLLAGTDFDFELNSSALTMDSVFVGGNFSLGNGTANLIGLDLGNGTIAANTVFTLVQMSANGTMSGFFSGLADGSDITIGGNTFQINYGTLTGYSDDLTLMDVSAVATPEPNQAILVVLGLVGLVGYRLRRASRVA